MGQVKDDRKLIALPYALVQVNINFFIWCIITASLFDHKLSHAKVHRNIDRRGKGTSHRAV